MYMHLFPNKYCLSNDVFIQYNPSLYQGEFRGGGGKGKYHLVRARVCWAERPPVFQLFSKVSLDTTFWHCRSCWFIAIALEIRITWFYWQWIRLLNPTGLHTYIRKCTREAPNAIHSQITSVLHCLLSMKSIERKTNKRRTPRHHLHTVALYV